MLTLPGGVGRSSFISSVGSLLEKTPTFSNVSLLIHGDERPFLDVSLNKHKVFNWYASCDVSSGKIALSTAQSHLKIPPSTAFVLGSGSWAMCAKATFSGSDGVRILDTRSVTGAMDGYTLNVQEATGIPFMQINGVNYGIGGSGLPASNLILSSGVESEIAFSYDGTNLRCFVGGLISWTHTVALNITSNNLLVVGNSPSRQMASDGFTSQRVCEIMLVKGEVLFDESYATKTRQSDTGIVLEGREAVTSSNVKLLLTGKTDLLDSSPSARTITVFGGVAVSAVQSRYGGQSIRFSTLGDRLVAANSADFNFPGDFCVELDVRPDSVSVASQLLVSNYQDSTSGFSMQQYNNVGQCIFNTTGDGIDIQTHDTALVAATWKHLAASRVSGLLMYVVEGELVEFEYNSDSVSSTQDLGIGRFVNFNSDQFVGYMQNIRIVKGESPIVRSFLVGDL